MFRFVFGNPNYLQAPAPEPAPKPVVMEFAVPDGVSAGDVVQVRMMHGESPCRVSRSQNISSLYPINAVKVLSLEEANPKRRRLYLP